MSYDSQSLFEAIVRQVGDAPLVSLAALSCKLGVSRRTIESNIATIHGTTFRALQMEAVLKKIGQFVSTNPIVAVKELSFAIGFKSPRSFARRIKTVTGMSPTGLRSHFAKLRAQDVIGQPHFTAAKCQMSPRQGLL